MSRLFSTWRLLLLMQLKSPGHPFRSLGLFKSWRPTFPHVRAGRLQATAALSIDEQRIRASVCKDRSRRLPENAPRGSPCEGRRRLPLPVRAAAACHGLEALRHVFSLGTYPDGQPPIT
jgi:hypothetical protein